MRKDRFDGIIIKRILRNSVWFGGVVRTKDIKFQANGGFVGTVGRLGEDGRKSS